MSVPDIRKCFDEVLLNVNPDATPGVPYSMFARSNKELLETRSGLLFNSVLERIFRIVEIDPTTMSIEERIDQYLVDPVRLFVKNEPHPKKKAEEGRWRLICSVSIVDKIIEMMLYSKLNSYSTANWRSIPPKPGMGFSYEDCQELWKIVETMPAAVGTDVSAWDWSVQSWMLEDEFAVRAALMRMHCLHSDAIKLMTRFADLASLSVYQTSGGTLLKLSIPRMQNSGRYNTSSGNSIMRALVSYHVGSVASITMGDDCVETYVDDATLKYQQLGITLKNYDRVLTEFEFCSRIYRRDVSYALNHIKSLLILFQHKIPDGQLGVLAKTALNMQLEDCYRTSPAWEELVHILERVGWYA
jgi:hypothetical protein